MKREELGHRTHILVYIGEGATPKFLHTSCSPSSSGLLHVFSIQEDSRQLWTPVSNRAAFLSSHRTFQGGMGTSEATRRLVSQGILTVWGGTDVPHRACSCSFSGIFLKNHGSLEETKIILASGPQVWILSLL